MGRGASGHVSRGGGCVKKIKTTPRILVVDDEKSDRDWLVQLLEAKGYTAIAVADGQSALDAALTVPPDLVMLDLKMPGLDGFEVTKRIKADPRTEAIPIVVVTGLDDRESRIRALECGAEDCLFKPVDRVEPGDVFIEGGFPGHAVIAVDVAESPAGRAVLLAQSYMPAQQVHVLVNPGDPALGPWYRYDPSAALATPEWRFAEGRAMRFRERGCPRRR